MQEKVIVHNSSPSTTVTWTQLKSMTLADT